MSRRKKTSYPGIFYREANRIGGPGIEKVFYIVFKKDGKVFEEKAGRQYADDMTPARAATIRGQRIEGKLMSRKEIKAEKAALKAAESNKYTIARLWERYKKNRPIKGIATDQSRYGKYIEPPFGAKEPKDILPLDVDRVRLKLLKKKAPATVKNVLELLRRIINYGTKKRLCEELNFTIEMPKFNNEQMDDLTTIQLNQLLKAIEKDVHENAGDMMKLVLFSGMRRGEMFKLRWNDIDFERGFINIKDPKGVKDQIIPLNDSARELLENHPRTKSKYVFPGRAGGQLVDISKAVNAIKTKAGLPKNFRPLHGLRHTYASMLASSGKVTMYHLQKLLTHKGPAMTQRYAHLRDEALKTASNLAGEIIKNNAKELKNGKDIKALGNASRDRTLFRRNRT